jgi:hypothetical protein
MEERLLFRISNLLCEMGELIRKTHVCLFYQSQPLFQISIAYFLLISPLSSPPFAGTSNPVAENACAVAPHPAAPAPCAFGIVDIPPDAPPAIFPGCPVGIIGVVGHPHRDNPAASVKKPDLAPFPVDFPVSCFPIRHLITFFFCIFS